MKFEIIPTVEHETSYIDSVLHDSLVSGIRINTGHNDFWKKAEYKIRELKGKTDYVNKDLWMDLKGRELRIMQSQNNNKKEQWIKMNHKIKVNTPCEMYFNDGRACTEITKVMGKNMRINSPVPVIFGKGTPINIPDNSLEIKDYYTKNDKKIIELANKNNIHNYMISFVEKGSEIEELLKYDKKANIVAKIESKKGMSFVKNIYPSYDNKVRLMAARGDLYVELERPHHLINALEDIIEADSDAILASRICTSVTKNDLMPSCTDLTDISYAMSLGYNSFLLGDELREEEKYVMRTIGIIREIIKNEKKKTKTKSIEKMLRKERGYVFKKPKEDDDVIVLFSGGLDSSIMIGLIIEEFKCRIHPLYIKRGAKAEKWEEESFHYFNKFYKKNYPHKIGRAEVLEAEIPPKKFKKNYKKEMIKTVGHPLRNSTMQNYALMYATSLSERINKAVKTIFVGSVGEDYFEPESGLLSLRAKTLEACIGRNDWGWQITSPMLERIRWDWKITRTEDELLYKPDLIYYAEEKSPVRIPYEKSRSCFSLEEKICKECTACTKREEAVKYYIKGDWR